HAQRDACESFIKSQAAEGWRLVKTAYDDGGLSGGTMERPGLQRLLSDIGEKLIDVVVVYKVDRLTRSLADFAKMVEIFDSDGVSFVVVTPAEAVTVRQIFERYLELRSVRLLKEELTRDAIVSKVRVSRSGKQSGGRPFGRGALYELLANPIYLGKIRHRKLRHPGQHPAIVDRAVWEQVG